MTVPSCIAAIALSIGALAIPAARVEAQSAARSQNARQQLEPREVVSDSVAVFKVHALRCSDDLKRHQLSGFLIRNPPTLATAAPGLATALHGTIGCRQYLAVLDGQVFNDLDFWVVDYGRDVLLFKSDQIEKALASKAIKPQAPLLPVSGVRSELWVNGYPENSPSPQPRRVVVSDTRKTLDDVLAPDDNVAKLRSRGSPALTHRVITFSGGLDAGDSGAPIADGTGAIAAIGNGGLRVSASGLAWGFPIEELDLKAYSDVAPLIADLRAKPAPELFAFEISPVRPAGLGASVAGSVAASVDTPEGQGILKLPVTIGNQRLFLTFGGGRFERTTTNAVNTLPGLGTSDYSETKRYGYFETGAAYYFRRLPTGYADPYVRAGFGLIDLKTANPLSTVLGGLDLLVNDNIITFIEVGGRFEKLPDATIDFNRYGNAERVESTVWTSRVRTLIGVRLALRSWTRG